MIVLLLVLAGGLGSAARFLVDGVVRAKVTADFPVGTVVINVSGSLLLGLVTGLTLARTAPDELRLIAGTGFLGGYTTFSTASFETVRLMQEGRNRAALLNGFGTLVVTTAAAALGLVLGLGI